MQTIPPEIAYQTVPRQTTLICALRKKRKRFGRYENEATRLESPGLYEYQQQIGHGVDITHSKLPNRIHYMVKR